MVGWLVDERGIEPHVNLIGRRQVERLARDEKVCHWGVLSGRGACLGDLTPNRKGSLARSAAEVSRDGFGTGNVEEVRDLIVNRQKPLRLSSGFESLHDPFTSSCRLVRILRAIVQTLMLAVFDVKAHLRPRSAVRTELDGVDAP